nr:hypothetical protein [Tanacetum cinerariifolium]
MIVQAPTDMGDTPVETHQTPIIDQPSTSKPQKTHKSRRKRRKEAEISHDESEDEDHVPTPSKVVMETTTGVKNLAGEEVVMKTTTGVKDSVAPTKDVTEDEIIMAQALATFRV